MGFLLGGSCSPCCQVPDSCLDLCRPPGETRPLTAINLTLTGADFTASWEQVQPATHYTVNYLWPGSLYSGTFSLTRTGVGSDLYEYKFPACGRTWYGSSYPYDAILPCEITPFLRYDASSCMLSMFLPGLLEPKHKTFFYMDRFIPPGSNIAPTCADSTTVVVERKEWDIKNCGAHNIQLMDGRVFIIDSTQIPEPTMPTVAVGDAVASDGVISSLFGGGTRGNVAIRSNLTEQFITPGTYAETGDPRLTLTRVTATYG